MGKPGYKAITDMHGNVDVHGKAYSLGIYEASGGKRVLLCILGKRHDSVQILIRVPPTYPVGYY